MTTSRIVRGNKGRIFAYVIAVVFITGIIACYNNTLSQLDEARTGREICQRENENLSTQLQMLSDYKQRLEKSIKTEKAEHQQSRKELETKLLEEKERNERTTSQIKLQLSSLQQSYQLLQTEHDDYKQKCADSQQEHANEMNQLQADLREVQEKLKKVDNDKENLKAHNDILEKKIQHTNNDASQWESKINQLTMENNELKRMLQEAKEVTEAITFETLSIPSESTRKTESSTNFSKQVSIDDATYQIRNDENRPPVNQNVADEPPAGVLPIPNADVPNNNARSSTKSSSKAILEGALPLRKSPTVTPETAIKVNANALPLPYKRQPSGVVDVKKGNENNNLEEIGKSLPNRYLSNIIENERANEEKAKRSEEVAAKMEEVEQDNGAHEELDFPPNEEKIKLDVHHINDMGIGDNLREDPQGKMAYVEQNEEEDDEEYGMAKQVNEPPAIRE